MARPLTLMSWGFWRLVLENREMRRWASFRAFLKIQRTLLPGGGEIPGWDAQRDRADPQSKRSLNSSKGPRSPSRAQPGAGCRQRSGGGRFRFSGFAGAGGDRSSRLPGLGQIVSAGTVSGEVAAKAKRTERADQARSPAPRMGGASAALR